MFSFNEGLSEPADAVKSSSASTGSSAVAVASKSAEITKAEVVRSSEATADSDDERDADDAVDFALITHPQSLRRYPITKYRYTTLKALIRYLYTAEPVQYARIKSAKPSVAHDLLPKDQRTSPKSMYRLAHEVDVPELIAQALNNYKSQLTSENIDEELFGADSLAYYPAVGCKMVASAIQLIICS